MHIHILGIGGTFMAGLAMLARELNLKVTGSDQNLYPPMSTQLEELGVDIFDGYDNLAPLDARPDFVVVGNVMSRGMPIVEALLDRKLPMLSGPEFLARFVLRDRTVLAVSGTHGKTTTSSMLAWILDCAGLAPGFLIGGIPNNFNVSARLGNAPFFVVEADEYDSAFFDKRSKFVHYQPSILTINNIEFDHADIFADLAAIQQQFHHLIRMVPSNGLIIYPSNDENVLTVLDKGCWTHKVGFYSAEMNLPSLQENMHKGWHADLIKPDGSEFIISYQGKMLGTINWELTGQHNIKNALAAIAAAEAAGVTPQIAIKALYRFESVKRRMELKGVRQEITVYDDFAHHPTAIHSTLAGLRAKVGDARIIAVVDIRSNTMREGYHQETLARSVEKADCVYFFHGLDVEWDVQTIWGQLSKEGGVYSDVENLLFNLIEKKIPGDQVIFMSNGGFGNIQNLFLERLVDLEKLRVLSGL